jgi:hypothetical protein
VPSPCRRRHGLRRADEVPICLRRLIAEFEPRRRTSSGRTGSSRRERCPGPPVPATRDAAGDRAEPDLVLFAHEGVRRLIVDWDIHARQALAEFRAATTSVRRTRDDRARRPAVGRQPRVPRLLARARRVPLRDPPAPLRPPARRHAHVRVPAAGSRRVPGLRVVVQLPVPATTRPAASPSATTRSDARFR